MFIFVIHSGLSRYWSFSQMITQEILCLFNQMTDGNLFLEAYSAKETEMSPGIQMTKSNLSNLALLG